MKILKLNPRKSKAQAIVEFAFVLPILLLVVYGLIETGRLLFIYTSVNNATRQAARFGSTSGEGPNGVPRFQDCAGIRASAQRADFLNAFDDVDITITYDHGPGTSTYDTCDGTTDSNVNAATDDRVVVSVNADYNTIVPLLPQITSRTVAGGNPISATSSRTLLLTISVPPPKEPTVTIITADQPDPSEIGGYVTVSVAVTSSKTTPTGTVTISGAEENCSVTLSNGTGSCNVRFTSLGTKALNASYSGDDKHESSVTLTPENHTVIRASTTTKITSDNPDPSVPNQPATLTVTVSSAWPDLTGTVTITGADTSNCSSLSGGPNTFSTTCTVSFSSVGLKTIIANYSGDSEHDVSNDDENHEVIPPGVSTTTITSDTPDPSQVGQSVTVNVSVTGTAATPTGTVSITGADTNCTITLSGGVGSCTVIFNSLGAKTLTATYGGDINNQGSSDTENHTVALPPTVTTITSDLPDPSVTGQAVNVTVTVTGGSTTPTGSVVITSSEGSFCTIAALSGGTGTCAGSFNLAGSKTLTASYSGDGSHAASNDTEAHVVTAATITACNTLQYSFLKKTNGILTIDINNTLGAPLHIGELSVKWNHDDGHKTGGDKTLQLTSANVNGVVFWSGTELGDTKNIIPNPDAFIQPGMSTITFIFHQTYDKWDYQEVLTVHFSNPGCENADLSQNQVE